jgi:hypothetical protein
VEFEAGRRVTTQTAERSKRDWPAPNELELPTISVPCVGQYEHTPAAGATSEATTVKLSEGSSVGY